MILYFDLFAYSTVLPQSFVMVCFHSSCWCLVPAPARAPSLSLIVCSSPSSWLLYVLLSCLIQLYPVLCCRLLLLIQMVELFKAGWGLTRLAPLRVRHLFFHHIQTNDAQVLFERSLFAHAILLDGRQQRLGLQHVLGSLGISELVLDTVQDHCLQWVVHSGGESSVNRLPELGLVPTHVDMTDDRLSGRENVIAGRPQTRRHDDLLSHEDPG